MMLTLSRSSTNGSQFGDHRPARVPLEMATIILSFLKILDEVILRGGVAIPLPRMLCSCWQVTRGSPGILVISNLPPAPSTTKYVSKEAKLTWFIIKLIRLRVCHPRLVIKMISETINKIRTVAKVISWSSNTMSLISCQCLMPATQSLLHHNWEELRAGAGSLFNTFFLKWRYISEQCLNL